jgi:hypothetical protein
MAELHKQTGIMDAGNSNEECRWQWQVTVKSGKLDVINTKHILGPIVFGNDDKI